MTTPQRLSADDACAIAVSRIIAARDSGAWLLSLGDLDLERLPNELATLTQLRFLALGGESYSEVNGRVERSLNPARPTFSDLAPLASLAALEALDLFRCYGVTDLTPLTNLHKLILLNLTACKGLTNLTPLAHLKALQRVTLDQCPVTDLTPLARLTALQQLNLNFCSGVSDLAALSTLSALQSLSLISCKLVSDIAPLDNLRSLQLLDMRQCPRVTDLTPLASLSGLKSLNLVWCEGVIDLTPIAALTGLTSLELMGSQGVTDLGPLASLASLQSLSVGASPGLTDLGPLSRLTNLQSLSCSGCPGVTDLQPLSKLTRLQSLSLPRCTGVTDIAPLAGLTRLRSLNLSFSGVRKFAPLVPRLEQFHKLNLCGCKCDDLPTAVCGEHENNNVLEGVRAHFADLNAGSEVDAERKVLILGNGGVGKTQLARRLRGLPYDQTIKSTHGIELGTLTVELPGVRKPVTLNLWDFGGQDIYHGAHSLFLQEEAVYLILWHPDRETGSITQDGLTMHQQPLTFWLDFVRSLAGEDAPVLIVQSQCDNPEQRVPSPPAMLEGLTRYRVLECSAATDLGIDVLKIYLNDAITGLVARRALYPIGKGRLKVREKLRQMWEEDRQRPLEQRQHQTLTVAEFEAICKQVGGVSDPLALLDFLHHTGVVYYRADVMQDRIVLDQEWALQAVYSLFHREKSLPVLRRLEGRFTRSDLHSLIWHDYSVDEQRSFLQMMQGCGICFPTGKVKDSEGNLEQQYIAPELLPDNPEGKNLVLRHLPKSPNAAVEVRYPFLHDGIVRGLLSQLGRRAHDEGVFWKSGCWFYEARSASELVLDRAPAPTIASPYAGTLSLRAWGGQAEELILAVLQIVESQRLGQPPEIVWTTRAGTGESPVVSELQIAAPPLQPRKDRPEVFISFAWGDDKSEEGRRREVIVDHLDVKLSEWGYEPIRDKREVGMGDSISGFMQRLGRGDRILVILSEKYLRSEFCMTELHYIYQRALGQQQAFLQHIVPVELDDVAISTIDQRIAHRSFWELSVKKLEHNINYLGSADHAKLLSQKKWCIDVCDILAFISNQRHPQGFEQIVANDYRGVRELLEGKMLGE